MDSLWQDARFGWRALRKQPVVTTVAVLSLVVGISMSAVVFSLLDAAVLSPLPVRDPDQLVWFRNPSFSYPVFEQIREHGASVFSGIFAWNVEQFTVNWGDDARSTQVLAASGDMYATLGVSAAAGLCSVLETMTRESRAVRSPSSVNRRGAFGSTAIPRRWAASIAWCLPPTTMPSITRSSSVTRN